MEQKPLQGKRVIVTRPKEQAEPFAQMLRGRGAEVLYFPAIEIVPPQSWDDADEAIAQDRAYDALVFTSSNAVRFYFDRARERGIGPEALLRKTVYVLGGKTAEAAAFYGAQPVRFAGVRNAHEFGAALVSQGARHRRYLVPKGRLAGSEVAETLRAHGATADEVIVYDTVMPAGAGAHGAREAIASGMADAITFFSPSSAENFFSLMSGCRLDGVAVAAIGDTTAAALKALDVRVDIVPAHPDAEKFAEAIERYFSDTLHLNTKNEDL